MEAKAVAGQDPQGACNVSVFKILTSTSYALKILQTLSAKSAPVKAFRGVGGGGYPSFSAASQNGTRSNPQFEASR